MKKVVIMLVIAYGLWTATPGAALAQFGCGLEPLPPIGFTYREGHCVCSSNGYCSWIFYH